MPVEAGRTVALAELLDALPPDLARQALTHASWVGSRADSYERLAFLGDVVLSLAISTDLVPRLEGTGAGRLTKVRAQAVAQAASAEVARELGLPERLSSIDVVAGGQSAQTLIASERVLASICESVIGAAYLANGYDAVAPAIVAAFSEQVEDALLNSVDFKSSLQERLARRAELVAYRIESEQGPPHQRSFVAIAEVDGSEIGRGEGRSKKVAEQAAAARALDYLDKRRS